MIERCNQQLCSDTVLKWLLGTSAALFSAGAWSFSVSELAAPGVEVGRVTATDPDLGENAQLEFTILDSEEAEIFNLTGRDQEAVIVLNKVSV